MNERASIVRQPATYQDVLDAPPNMVAELIRGALHLHPRPAPRHAMAGSHLGGELYNPFSKGSGGPGGWVILYEPELHLRPALVAGASFDVLVPDFAGWRRERMPHLPETAFFEIVPDWVCEILSPSTRKIDMSEKQEIYAASGVKFHWFIDPDVRRLEAFELIDGRWVLLAALHEDAEVRVAPFDAIAFSLSALWPD